MNFSEYADLRLELEARMVETYEEENEAQRLIDLERDQLLVKLRENFEKYNRLHAEKEQVRKGLKEAIGKLEAEYERKEVVNG